MKVAVISHSNKGALLVQALSQNMEIRLDVYANSGRDSDGAVNIYECISELVRDISHNYDGFVFVMPVSMVVKVIAPHLRDKRFDPVVVVVDEAGDHAISLLDGHGGRVGKLTLMVAKAIGARPIITNATDSTYIPTADVLAIKLDLSIEPFDQLQQLNSMIAKREKVVFFIDNKLANAKYYTRLAAEMGVVLQDIDQLVHTEQYDGAIVISDAQRYMVKPHVYLRPATLAIGVDFQPGITSTEILTAINDACKKIGRSTKSIAVIAAITHKQDEVGLLATVQQLEIPLEFFTSEQLEYYRAKIGISLPLTAYTGETGLESVSEASALCAAQNDRVLLNRIRFSNVEIAIAEFKYRS